MPVVNVHPGNENHSPQKPTALLEQEHNAVAMKPDPKEDESLASLSTTNFSTQAVSKEPSKDIDVAQEFSVPSTPSAGPVKESLITALNDLAKEGNAVKPVTDSTLPSETPPYQSISIMGRTGTWCQMRLCYYLSRSTPECS